MNPEAAATMALFFNHWKKVSCMSQAFIREGDDQTLDEVRPTLQALILFLTRENGGVRVYEKERRTEGARDIHVMSNGLSYTKDDRGRWMVTPQVAGR